MKPPGFFPPDADRPYFGEDGRRAGGEGRHARQVAPRDGPHRVSHRGRSQHQAGTLLPHLPLTPLLHPASTLPAASRSARGLRAQEKRTVAVRRGENGLGIDVSERNVILRVLPHSLAATDGALREGDVIVGVDGEDLGKRWLAEVRTPTSHAHALHTPCTRHAHAMHTPCTCQHAPAR